MWELARRRAATVEKIPLGEVCDKQIEETLFKLQKRNEADILFDPNFVLNNPTLAQTYYRVLNNPLKGEDALKSQLLQPVCRLANSALLAS